MGGSAAGARLVAVQSCIAALRFGNTPFDDAIREGDMEMAEYLLSKGSRNLERTDPQVGPAQCTAPEPVLAEADLV